MDSSGDIYSGDDRKEPSPFKGHQRRKSIDSPKNADANPSLSKERKARSGKSSSRRRRRAKRRRLVAACFFIILMGYAFYTAFIAVRGVIRQRDPSGSMSIMSFFSGRSAAEDFAEGARTESAGINVDQFVAALEQSRSIERDVRDMLNRNLAAQAIERIQSAPATVPRTAQMTSMLAEAQMMEREWEDAIETLVGIVASETEVFRYRLMLARALLNSEQFDAALSATRWALVLDENSSEARSLMADSYISLGMYGEAIPELRRILDDNPGDDSVRSRLAMAYYEGGEYARAVRLLEDLISRDTDHSLAYYNLALCYAKQNLSDQVVRTLSRARRRFGDSFVRAWIQSEEFDAIRNSSDFIMFANQIERGPDVTRLQAPRDEGDSRSIEIGTSPLQFDDRSERLLNRN